MVNPFEILIQQNAEILQHLQDLKALGISIPVKKEGVEEEDQKFSIAEVANYLKKGKATIQRYKNDGALPYHQVGRTVFFKKSEVDAAMSSMVVKKKGAKAHG